MPEMWGARAGEGVHQPGVLMLFEWLVLVVAAGGAFIWMVYLIRAIEREMRHDDKDLQ